MKQYRVVYSHELRVYKIQESEDNGETWSFSDRINITRLGSIVETDFGREYGSFDAAEHAIQSKLTSEKKPKSDADYTWEIVSDIYKIVLG